MNAFVTPLTVLALAGCAPLGNGNDAREYVPGDPDLRGKVAGTPQSCVSVRDLRNNRSSGTNQILFATNGGLVWVNNTATQCTPLRPGLSLRTETRSGRLCDGDVVSVVDLQSGFGHGTCSLGPFTPYRATSRSR